MDRVFVDSFKLPFLIRVGIYAQKEKDFRQLIVYPGTIASEKTIGVYFANFVPRCFHGKCPSPRGEMTMANPFLAIDWQAYLSGPFTGTRGNRRRLYFSKTRFKFGTAFPPVIFRCFPRQKRYLVVGTRVVIGVESIVLYRARHEHATYITIDACAHTLM